MIRWISYLLASLLAAAALLWLGVRTPMGQHLARHACGQAIRSFGLRGSVEHIDVVLPFYIRLEGLKVEEEAEGAQEMISCEELSITPLFLDLPFGRITLLNVHGKGVFIDADAIEASAAASAQLPSCSILRLRLDSLRLTSRRGSFDGSLRAGLSFSDGSCRLTGSLQQKSAWPKQVEFSFSQQEDKGLQATARICLGTDQLADARRLLFGPKDLLDISVKADSLWKGFSGSWTLTCPSSSAPLRDDLSLTQAGSGRGSFSYQRGALLTVVCDAAEKKVVFKQPEKDLYTAALSGRGSLELSFNEKGGCHAALCLSSCSLNDFCGSLSATVEGDDQSLTLVSEGQLQKGAHTVPLKCQASSQCSAAGWTLSADLFATPFLATFDYASAPEETNGRGTIRCQDLSILEGPLPTICGSADLSASLHSDAAGLRYAFSGNLSDFHWQGFECQNGTVRWSQDQTMSFSADFTNAQIRALHADEAHTILSYDLRTHALSLLEAAVKGRLHGLAFSISGTGEGQATASEGTLTIDNIQGSVAENPISLDRPIRIGCSGGCLVSLAGALRVGTDGRIGGEWHQAPYRQSGDLAFERIPFSHFMTAMDGPESSGTFDGRIHFQSCPKDVAVHASMNASIARFGVLGGSDGGLALGSTLDIEEGRAAAEICVAGKGINEPLLVKLFSPVARDSRWPFLSIDREAPIHGVVKGDIHLTELLGGWLPDQAGFEAVIGCDATIGGTASDPSFRGDVHVREGRIDVLPTGEVIKNIAMEGTLDHHRLTLHRIEASDEKQGRITGTGLVEVTPSKEFHWQAALRCSNVEAICLDYASATADGEVRLEGGLDGMSIVGSAIASKALIDLAVRFPSDTPEFPVTYIGEKPPDHSPFLVNFDLSVDAGSGVEIRGRGLTSQWKGHLHLGGEASSLLLDGSLRCLEGSFYLSNKALTINEGSVTVAGDLFQDSRLNVIANVALPTILAEVHLKGSLETPKISIRSTPPRPDSEILSLILFNKEFGDISALQSLQLANIAMSIEHPSGPFGFVDRMKENLGIDLIDVGSQVPTPMSSSVPSALDPSDTGPPPPQMQNDVSIKVGKYISDGVAVTVSRAVGSDTNYVGFEAQLAPEITAEAQVGADEIGILSIKWKKNY